MKLLRLILSSVQMAGSVILFFISKSFVASIFRYYNRIGSGVDLSIQQDYINLLLVIFAILFLIGLFFFLDTIRMLNKNDFAMFKNKTAWVIVLILAIAFLLWYIFNTFSILY